MFSVRWTLPEPFDRIVPALGVLAFVSALLFIRQASRKISLRTMVGLPEVEPHKRKQPVLISGIYSRTRNPIYFGHWLLVFSAAAVSSFAANWIGFGLDCVILPLLIRSEERELLARYGNDFADYMRRVPRFFPQLATRRP
jgi:protein-S-isoprenylcysteine O-methyltransferase Ste14